MLALDADGSFGERAPAVDTDLSIDGELDPSARVGLLLLTEERFDVTRDEQASARCDGVTDVLAVVVRASGS